MRTVLWDLDGTLADTTELHFQAWMQTLAAYAIPYDFDQFIAGFGRDNRSVLSGLLQTDPANPLIDRLIDEVAQRKEQTYRELLAQAALRPLPGVLDWLARFEQAGVRQMISSSGPMANIAATIAKLGVGDFFMGLMSGATLPRSKPDPALFLLSAAAAGAPPAACIVVEDSIHGIGAARHAAMPSIAVGKLAGSAALAELLAALPGPPCTAVASLTKLTWSTCEHLWEQVHV
jgi:HAD superfamily hydrolase (TIGR01509 family)